MESIDKLIDQLTNFVLRPKHVIHKALAVLLLGGLTGCVTADSLRASAPAKTVEVDSHDLVGSENRFDDTVVTIDLCINATMHDITLQDCIVGAPQIFLESDAGRQSAHEYSRLLDFAFANMGMPPESLPVTVQGRYRRTFSKGAAIHTIYIQRLMKLQNPK
jgi:hypothetical protein